MCCICLFQREKEMSGEHGDCSSNGNRCTNSSSVNSGSTNRGTKNVFHNECEITVRTI